MRMPSCCHTSAIQPFAILLTGLMLTPCGLGAQAIAPTGAGEAQTAAAGSSTVKDGLFDDTGKFAKGASRVSEIDMDPATMAAVGSDTSYAKHYRFSIVHTYGYDKPGMYKQEDLEEYHRKLAEGGWRCSVHVREKDHSTDICNRLGPDRETRESVVMEISPLKLTFIHSSELVSAEKSTAPEVPLQKHK